jgi:hypothetical protein
MGQDWKTLGLVAVGAAIVGWVLVRLLTGAPAHRDAMPIAAAPTAARNVESVEAPTEDHAAPRAATARATAAPAPDDDGEVAYITRDLETLSSALVRDQRIEDRVMPRINDALDVPGVTSYRRAPDFWEPAFGGPRGGANR